MLFHKIVISIHAPTRGATMIPVIKKSVYAEFQSTLLQEERQKTLLVEWRFFLFQSTLLQEERHLQSSEVKKQLYISIHAPTRGATKAESILLHDPPISIHAPTRGATYFLISFTTCSSNFNPRSYKRSDLFLLEFRCQSKDFNPRSYKRSD